MNKHKAQNLSQITFKLYAEKNIEEFDEGKIKLLLDNSIFGTFGLLEAYKIKYSLKKEIKFGDEKYSQFLLKAFEK